MRKSGAICLLVGAAVSQALAAPESDFHLPFERYQLKNGMRVVLSRDASVPIVSVYLVYGVGSRSEEKGHTGFANLAEHLMYEGSANVKKGDHIRSVQATGGQAGGATRPDFTEYFETLPSNKLELALWLESDRLRNPAITAENVKAQREAIHLEQRMRFDNEEYSTALIEKWPALVFSNPRNSHPLNGSPEDMEGAGSANLSQFVRTWYAPNDAVLAIAGDFDTAETKKMAERYFGDASSQPQPAQYDTTEPLRTQGKTDRITDPYARVPAIAVGWPAPERRSTDLHALQLLDAVLAGGPNSRLQRDLVKGRASLIECKSNVGWPFGDVYQSRDPTEYGIFAVYRPNYRPQQIEDQIQGEIDQIARAGVDELELRRVKSMLRFRTTAHLQASLERARLLGLYELLDGNPAKLEEDLASLSAVTSAQIQDVAKKYLTLARRDALVVEAGKNPYLMLSEHYHLLLDNAWMRASLVTYGPHESAPLHEHPEAPTVIYIYVTDGGQFRFTHLTPHQVTLIRPAVKAGAIRLSHSEPETHTVEYLGDVPTEYVRIELRTENHSGPLKNSVLPPPPVDPARPIVLSEFENNEFRVLRVVCAAGQPCPASTHPDDPAIVTVMSGPGKGAVHWSPAAETGPLDEVRIELKTPPAAPATGSK